MGYERQAPNKKRCYIVSLHGNQVLGVWARQKWDEGKNEWSQPSIVYKCIDK